MDYNFFSLRNTLNNECLHNYYEIDMFYTAFSVLVHLILTTIWAKYCYYHHLHFIDEKMGSEFLA